MKKFALIVLVALLTSFMLSACGGSGDSSANEEALPPGDQLIVDENPGEEQNIAGNNEENPEVPIPNEYDLSGAWNGFMDFTNNKTLLSSFRTISIKNLTSSGNGSYTGFLFDGTSSYSMQITVSGNSITIQSGSHKGNFNAQGTTDGVNMNADGLSFYNSEFYSMGIQLHRS